jgi:beta-glucosidase
MTTPKRTDFPNDFLWGTATASYQIEGAVHQDGRTPSIWDTFSHTPGKVKHGDTGDVACDHYHRYASDLDLMSDLGVNAYRLSVSWSRVIPNGRGPTNAKGLAFYDRLIDGLLERKIEPWVTLYHWDLPQVLQDMGGWDSRDTAFALADYANVVTHALGDRVKNWITINEPWCVAYLGYGIGIHAPGKTDLAMSLRAAHNVLLAHGMSVPVVRSNSSGAKVGITLNLTPGTPASDSGEDAAATKIFDGFFNRWYLDPVFGNGYPADMIEAYGPFAPKVNAEDLKMIGVKSDFLGINYYSRGVIKHDPSQPLGVGQVRLEDVKRTFMDWEVYPQGLEQILYKIKNDYDNPPIYITENGASYPDASTPDGSIHDTERRDYFERHFAACRDAMQNGVDLKGYFAWSLLDNFEWAEGYEKRFGIVHVNFETQERRLKDSGKWYKKFLSSKE